MHPPGRRLAITLLPALIFPLAIGCTGNSGGQFHAYQSSSKSPEDQRSDKGEAGQTGKLNEAKSPEARSSQTEVGSVQQKNPQSPAGAISAAPPTSAKGDSKTPQAIASSSGSNSSSPVPPAMKPTAPATNGLRTVAASEPRKVQVLVPNKTFRTEGEALRVSYDDIDLLKVLNMDPVLPDAATYMPAWLKSLDGRRIRIRGFMYPTFQQTGVHAFGLARDNQICCFGRNPKIYDVFDVVLHEGTTTNYIPNRPFDVVGVFHIRPEAEDGKIYRLYEMDDASVVTK
jgi:hypothetical protein